MNARSIAAAAVAVAVAVVRPPRRSHGQGPRPGDGREDGQPQRRGKDTRPEGQEDGSAGQVSRRSSALGV